MIELEENIKLIENLLNNFRELKESMKINNLKNELEFLA